ncbi:hypothetical protein BD410DRAFT_783458 [Rickenella mellea]|uniref:Uncharacterized protein n=1 Tax=Rickenella mellea TaxID=50990 RepID=A0A4Y7QFH4_9AGAM|nr:hypothetical protein BD410DRAFT_783458 [Rickenella mellea]
MCRRPNNSEKVTLSPLLVQSADCRHVVSKGGQKSVFYPKVRPFLPDKFMPHFSEVYAYSSRSSRAMIANDIFDE